VTDASNDLGQYRDYCFRLTSHYETQLRKYPNIVKRCLSKALDNLRHQELKEMIKDNQRMLDEM